jgi:hypothetical protein
MTAKDIILPYDSLPPFSLKVSSFSGRESCRPHEICAAWLSRSVKTAAMAQLIRFAVLLIE